MSDGTVIESLIVEWRLEYDSFKRKSEEVKKEAQQHEQAAAPAEQ